MSPIDDPQAAPRLPDQPRTVVADLFPFLASLTLHVGLIVLGVATVGVIRTATAREPRVQTVVRTMLDGAEVADAGLFAGASDAADHRAAAQDRLPDVVDAAGAASAAAPRASLAELAGGSGQAASDPLISIGPGALPGAGGERLGPGNGPDAGPGDGRGAIAPFGVPGGSGFGAGSGGGTLFTPCAGARAMKVAFVCDASGSMMQTFDVLRVELRKALGALRPPQSFSVIFFQETRCVAADPKLLFASPENKRRAYDFIDRVQPRSTTDPLPAIRVAFEQGAELIYLLTDGDFPDNRAVAEECRRLNPGARVKVNTILFSTSADAADASSELTKVMQQIATDSGGAFKRADADKLP